MNKEATQNLFGMDETTYAFMEKLSNTLGVGMDHVWQALLLQAKVTGIQYGIGICVMTIVYVIVMILLLKTRKVFIEKDDEAGIVFLHLFDRINES